MPTLDALRTEIAQVDLELVALAARRLALAREVGDIKARAGLPIVDYAQERTVLERAREAAAAAGLDAQVADAILGALIRAAVGAQDQDRWRSSSLGAGKTCVVIGARGRMGRWFLRFLADQGYQVGGLDVLASDAENAWGRDTLASADLVLCAAPPVATARIYDDWVTSGAPPRGVILDIASIKSPLVPSIRRLQAAGARVGSLHPMFGPSVALLRDVDVVVCDTGDAAARDAGAQLFASTTARIVALPIDEHDHLMADVLTLAHVTVMAFALALPAESTPLRSPTLSALRTLATALVRESADVYFEIQAHNPHSASAISRLAEAVTRVSEAVGSHDSDGFRRLMDDGKTRTEVSS